MQNLGCWNFLLPQKSEICGASLASKDKQTRLCYPIPGTEYLEQDFGERVYIYTYIHMYIYIYVYTYDK